MSLFPAFTQLRLRQAERPAVRQTQNAGQKPEPTFISTTEVTITANRKRNQTLSIRLTPAEKKEINSVNTGRKERDYSQSNAGADDLDGLSD